MQTRLQWLIDLLPKGNGPVSTAKQSSIRINKIYKDRVPYSLITQATAGQLI